MMQGTRRLAGVKNRNDRTMAICTDSTMEKHTKSNNTANRYLFITHRPCNRWGKLSEKL